ncbi:MAG: DUF2298 domain-containing protein, partial [Candidatus Promineifilaceae bacterium]
MPAADFLAAVRWWAVLTLLGLLAFPVSYRLLRWLPDRGYTVSRMVGVLLSGYAFWLLTSLGFTRNDEGGLLAGLLALAAAGYLAQGRIGAQNGRPSPFQWLRAHRGYVLAAEALFLLSFALWVWIKAQNPAITATEKPMEFAFLNSAGRSPS